MLIKSNEIHIASAWVMLTMKVYKKEYFMRFAGLAVLLCFSCVSAAFAQGTNTITVIQDDGSKAVVDIGKPQSESAPPAEPAEKAPQPNVPAKSVIFSAPQPQTSPEPAPEPDPESVKADEPKVEEPKAEQPKEEQAKEAMPKEDAPKIEAQSIEKPKTEAAKADKPKSKPKKKSKPAAKSEVKSAPAPKFDLPPGQYISPEQAFAIAAEEAPPAMGFEPYKAMINGNDPGYGFVFNTDRGPYKVVVDAHDGAIVISRPVHDDEVMGVTKPGHLPVR